MSDDSARPPGRPSPSPIYNEVWSAISQGDLGLKAGYWKDEPGGEVVFRPIVGWVTWFGSNMGAPTEPTKRGFVAVVIAGTCFPTIAQHAYPKYVGVFPAEMSSDDARKKSEEWSAGGGSESQSSGMPN
jgi:hypothetical protein